MAFEKGDPRPEGSGRKKGTPNKRTQELIELAEQCDADPFMFLIHVMKGDAKALGIGSNSDVEYDDDGNEKLIPKIDFETRMEAAKELMPYLYAKRKSVELKMDDVTRTIQMNYKVGGDS